MQVIDNQGYVCTGIQQTTIRIMHMDKEGRGWRERMRLECNDETIPSRVAATKELTNDETEIP